MRYYGTVIRPPSEAHSAIFQVTYGCSHNRCTFCGTYRDKPFQVRPEGEALADIARVGRAMPATRRAFLADGNALVLSTQRLVAILDALNAAFPHLERVGTYANARDILHKSADDLALLRRKGLGIVYVGLESGSDDVLEHVRKGATSSEMIDAVHKAKAAGMQVSVIAILGLGGPEGSDGHAEATGRVVSAMDPHYLALLTLMLVPGTELYDEWRAGAFQLMGPEAMLAELRQVIGYLVGLSACVFRTNHASNYLPLGGTLPQDKARLLATLDAALARGTVGLRPESWRAL
ncbi:MAG: radical SAM protein [Anaerolineae bacterium]|nr:radical SAM protein [Anaerolineae bacterium]